MIFVSRRVPSICSPIILVFYPKKTNNHDVAAVAVRRGLNRPAQGFDDDVVAVAVAGAVGAAGGG